MDSEDIPLDRTIDNKVLIKEVKKRHCIYDKHNKEYTNAAIKQIKWREVAEIVFAKYWNSWNRLMRDRAVEFTIKRWCNLRNCFLRELRKAVSDNGYKMRRQYIYFNDLIFLKDYIEKKDQYDRGLKMLDLGGSRNIKSEDQSCQDEDDDDDEQADQGDDECHVYDTEYLDEEEAQDIQGDEAIAVLEFSPTPPKRHRESYADNSDPLQSKRVKKDNRRSKISVSNDRLSNIVNDAETVSYSSQLTVDQDMNFALSLVPMLRALSPSDKIDVQIKVLSIFKDYNSSS